MLFVYKQTYKQIYKLPDFRNEVGPRICDGQGPDQRDEQEAQDCQKGPTSDNDTLGLGPLKIPEPPNSQSRRVAPGAAFADDRFGTVGTPRNFEEYHAHLCDLASASSDLKAFNTQRLFLR